MWYYLTLILLAGLAGTQPVSNEKFIDPRAFGAVYGDLAETIKDPSGQTPIRKKNYQALRQACRSAMEQQLPVYISGKLQIRWGNYGHEQIVVGNRQRLRVCGDGPETSWIDLHPKVNSIGTFRFSLFTADDGSEIHLENLQLQGVDHLYDLQTYNAVLGYGGNRKLIRIQDSVQLWRPLWQHLQPGDSVLYCVDRKTPGAVGIVASTDPGKRLIHLQENIQTPVQKPGPATYVGIYWPEEADPASVKRFSKGWYQSKLALPAFNYVDLFSQKMFREKSVLKVENAVIEHFSHGLNRSGGWVEATISGTKLQAEEIGITFYTGDFPDNPSSLQAFDSEFYECGMIQTGGFIDHPRPSAGSPYPLWGSGFYLHPNIPITISGCRFLNNHTGALREYSGAGAGSKRAAVQARAVIENCHFENNQEYSLLTSGVMPTTIRNTTFQGYGSIRTHNTLYLDSCRIFSSIGLSGLNKPSAGKEDRYFINLRNSYLSGFNTSGWDAEELNRTTLLIEDCWTTMKLAPQSKKEENSIFQFGGQKGDITDLTVDIDGFTIKFPGNGTSASMTKKSVGDKINALIKLGSGFKGNISIRNLKLENLEERTYQGTAINNSYIRNAGTNIAIEDSDLSAWLYLVNDGSRMSFKNGVTINRSIYFAALARTHFYIAALRPGEVSRKIMPEYSYGSTPEVGDGGNLQVVDHLQIDQEHDTYRISGDTLRSIALFNYAMRNPNARFHRGTANHRFRGTITVIPENAIVLVPYPEDPRSNILAEARRVLKKGQPVVFRGNPDLCLSRNQPVWDTLVIATGDGKKTHFEDGQGSGIAPVVPNTTRLFTDDGINIPADYHGFLDTRAVKGILYPFNHNAGWELEFTVPPKKGSRIMKVFQQYKDPDWYGYYTIEE